MTCQIPSYLKTTTQYYIDNIIETNCLKYADDLVLMSTSTESLQKCLNNLESYCGKWKLEINTKKPKVVLFNHQGSLITKHQFHYKQGADLVFFLTGGIQITSWPYLGWGRRDRGD